MDGGLARRFSGVAIGVALRLFSSLSSQRPNFPPSRMRPHERALAAVLKTAVSKTWSLNIRRTSDVPSRPALTRDCPSFLRRRPHERALAAVLKTSVSKT